MAFDQTKRETLKKLTASLLTISGVSPLVGDSHILLNGEREVWLSLTGQASSTSAEQQSETLEHFERLITHCWELSRGKQPEIWTAKALAQSCLPMLTESAHQTSPLQKHAADLAAQWYRLCAILGYHTENVYVAESYARNAIKYSKIADNPDIIVASFALNALVLYYANRPAAALEKCVEAEQYANKATYAVQSFLYRRKAVCLAQLQQKEQALRTLDRATETFYRQPKNEVPLSYAEHNEFEMLLWEGVTRYHLDQPNTAVEVLNRLQLASPRSEFPERIRTGFLNNLIFAEVRKLPQQRDLDLCIALWQEAAQSAIRLQSELRYDEVARAYSELSLAFPGELRIKKLQLHKWDTKIL